MAVPFAQEGEDEEEVRMEELELERFLAEALEDAAEEVATDVGRVVERCETARAELGKAAALLREPGEASSDPVLCPRPLLRLDPAAISVESLFKGPGPLADHTPEAAALVRSNFSFAAPEGGELQAARRELLGVILISHPDANRLFGCFTEDVGVPPGAEDASALWEAHYLQADAQAREALRRLEAAAEASLAAHRALDLCEEQRAVGEPPGAHLSDAEVMLDRTIDEVDKAITELWVMHNSLEELGNVILSATGQAP